METVLETTVLSKVKDIFVTTLKLASGKLDVDAGFDTLGIDSIIAMDLMRNLSERLGISLNPAHFTSVKTVRELAEYIDTHLLPKDGPHIAAPAAPVIASAAVTPSAAIAPAAVLTATANGASAAKPAPSPKRPQGSRGQEAPARKPIASRPAAKPLSKAGPASLQALAGFIGRKYDIDLGSRSFGSLDEIAEAMVTEHTDALLDHYGIGEAEAKKAGTVPGESDAETGSAHPRKFPDVAIVGMACRFPDAPNPQRFWNNLMGRKNSMREIPSTRWNWEEFYKNPANPRNTVSKWAALIEDVDCFDPAFFRIQPEEARLMDPQERLILQETYNAFLDAGLNPAKLRGSRTGAFIGYEYSEYEQFLRENRNRLGFPLPYTSSSPSYYLANRLSFVFDLRGPSESINMTCASSALAVARAYASLLDGESDLAVAGGVSLNLFSDDYAVLSRLGVLSPDGTCGVFDDSANGYTRGEGVGVVVLKRLEDARKDNNRIYGVIKACHQSHKGNANFISEIRHESITSMLEDCYGKAAIAPETIRYIEVDGYATKWGDSFEFEGIKNAFRGLGGRGKTCALGSLKGNIGHLEPASGIAALIKLALSLHKKKFPATISHRKASSFLDIGNPSHPLFLQERAQDFETLRDAQGNPIRVGLNSFADTGVNLHILLEEYRPASPVEKEMSIGPQLILLSARNRERLAAYARELITCLSDSDGSQPLAEWAYTLQVGRETMEERLALIASTPEELMEKLEAAAKALEQGAPALENLGFYYGDENARKNVLAQVISGEILARQIEISLLQGQWKTLALLWVSGVTIPWERVWEGKAMRPLPLPGYPFARQRHWIDLDVPASKVPASPLRGPRLQADIPAAPNAAAAEARAADWEFQWGAAGGESLEPALKIELFLRQEIGSRLGKGIDDVDIDANFLELGLDSLAIGDFLAKTNQLLRINVSPSAVFKYPQVRGFSSYLTSAYPENVAALAVAKGGSLSPRDATSVPVAPPAARAGAADVLVPMQSVGVGVPIFAVPGVDGSVLSLQQLSLALGDKQPFYGLEGIGLDGNMPAPSSLEENAEINLAAMAGIVDLAKGPLILLGYSSGGALAFEMARRLLERGGEVSALWLLDGLCPTHAKGDFLESVVEICHVAMGRIGKTLALTASELQQVPEGERCSFLYASMTGQGFELPREQFAATYQTLFANERNYLAYAPSKLPRKLSVTLLKATRGFKDVPADYGWNAFLAEPLRVLEIEADHFSIIDKEPSQEVAKRIQGLARNGAPKKPYIKSR